MPAAKIPRTRARTRRHSPRSALEQRSPHRDLADDFFQSLRIPAKIAHLESRNMIGIGTCLEPFEFVGQMLGHCHVVERSLPVDLVTAEDEGLLVDDMSQRKGRPIAFTRDPCRQMNIHGRFDREHDHHMSTEMHETEIVLRDPTDFCRCRRKLYECLVTPSAATKEAATRKPVVAQAKPISGTIRSIAGAVVTVSIGRTAGMKQGTKLIVFRDGTFVGYLLIGRVADTTSTGSMSRTIRKPAAGDTVTDRIDID